MCRFWLFRSWGRIGTTIGGNKVEDCKSVHDAIHRFEELYEEKTQNSWDERDNFVKVNLGSARVRYLRSLRNFEGVSSSPRYMA